MLDAAEGVVRRRLAALGAAALERVLTPAELEALRYGTRERVTDLHLQHIRDLPGDLPQLLARAGAHCPQVTASFATTALLRRVS
jgi:dimethylglycine catabolism A